MSRFVSRFLTGVMRILGTVLIDSIAFIWRFDWLVGKHGVLVGRRVTEKSFCTFIMLWKTSNEGGAFARKWVQHINPKITLQCYRLAYIYDNALQHKILMSCEKKCPIKPWNRRIMRKKASQGSLWGNVKGILSSSGLPHCKALQEFPTHDQRSHHQVNAHQMDGDFVSAWGRYRIVLFKNALIQHNYDVIPTKSLIATAYWPHRCCGSDFCHEFPKDRTNSWYGKPKIGKCSRHSLCPGFHLGAWLVISWHSRANSLFLRDFIG